MVSTHRMLIDYRIKYLLFNLVCTTQFAKIDNVRCILWYGFISLDIGNDTVRIPYVTHNNLCITNRSGVIPYIHYPDHHTGKQHCNPTTMHELRHIGDKEDAFKPNKGYKEQCNSPTMSTFYGEISTE